jgi:caffeoyl-CoA O-methyltransferase
LAAIDTKEKNYILYHNSIKVPDNYDSMDIRSKKLNMYSVPAMILLLILVSLPADAQRRSRWGSSAGSRNESYFMGIDDEKVLPMLKYLPWTYGGMNIPAGDGRFLYDYIIEKGYTRGLEIGTSNGYSGLWIGLALKKNGGKLVTIEIDPRAASEARRNFRNAGLDDVIEVITGDALKEIPKVPGKFDFVFIDAYKPQYLDYLKLVRHRVKYDGSITARNITDSGTEMANFVEVITKDHGLETEMFRRHNMSISRVIK